MDRTAMLHEMRTAFALTSPNAHAIIKNVSDGLPLPPPPGRGPKMRYLTRSYVEALGLLEVPGHIMRPVVGWVSPDAAKPETKIEFIQGVIYNEKFYRRSNDGLSYDLPTAPAFIR